MKKYRIFAVSLLFLLIFNSIFSLTAFSATEEHIERIFAKIAADKSFMTSVYEAGKLYSGRGVTNQYIDNQIKNIVANTINIAVELKRTGNLTKDDFTEKMKTATKEMYMTLDSILLSVFLEAFPENMIRDILAERLPTSLEPLYVNIMNEAQTLLFAENIADTRDYRFLDIETHLWAKEAILDLAYAGVIDGMDEVHFLPWYVITREQFVKLMAVICELDLENTKSEFWDVPKDSWYFPYVSAMADAGYVTGFGDGMFGTEEFITRQDIAVLIYRIGLKTGKFTENTETHEFVDSENVSDYAKEAVNLLYSYKIITGTPENYFNPQDTATRAESAQMLYKFYKIYMGLSV